MPKLVTYAVLSPKLCQSGESQTDGYMSKCGSPYLRRAILLAATVVAFKDQVVSCLIFGYYCM